MEYYDIILETCDMDNTIEKKLGFKKIHQIVIDSTSKIVYQDNPKIKKLIKNKIISAVVSTDYTIDKNLFSLLLKNNIIFIIKIPNTSQRFNLSRNLYKISNLFTYLVKHKILTTFITLSQSNTYLCSYIQLIEFAKFIGANEQYAKFCLSNLNKLLIQKISNETYEEKI